MANSPEKMNNGEDMSRLWYDFSEEGIKDELSDSSTSELAAEVIALRGGKDSIKNGEWNDNLKAYIDGNGMPTDYAHLVSYLKKNPAAVETLKKERDEARNALNDENGKFTDQTYEQWQAESMRKNAENLFPDDPLAQEIASTNSLLKDETKEQFVDRIRRAAEAQRIAESGPSRMETGESQAAYNKRIAEATDAAMKREDIISAFDQNRPLWPQLSDEQKKKFKEAYPRYDNESIPDWQARVEQELGVPVWMNSKAEAGNNADAGVDGGTGADASGEPAGGDTPIDNPDGGSNPIGDADPNGGANGENTSGQENRADGGNEAGAENKEVAVDGLRTDFENWEHWSDAERGAVLALINSANAIRKKAAEGGAGAGAAGEGADGKKEDDKASGGDAEKADGESAEDKRINNIVGMANGETSKDQDDNNAGDKKEKKGLRERIRNSKIGRKAIAAGLAGLMLIGTGLLLTRSDRGPSVPEPNPDGVEDTNDDEDPIPDDDQDDGETGENNEARQFSDTYFFYNTDARGVEKNSDVAFCNAGEVLTTCLAEHPEWSDFETNEDSYNALMNAAQVKLSETGREYAAVTAWQICKQTNGAFFGDFFNPNMTADEAEAVVDAMDAEQSQAFFAELTRAQSSSKWSADTLNGSGFTSGIRDANLEGDVSNGFMYNVENCQEADLIILNKEFDGVNVQKQVFYDENGNALGAIYIRVDLENATITTDPKGVVSIDDLSCCNVDVPTDTDGGTPDTPTPTPDTPTPTPPTPDTPTPTPTPEPTPTPTPTPEPTPTPDEGKKPEEVRDGDTQLQANPEEGTDAPAETAPFNNETNNDGSDGVTNYEQAPDQSTQVGAQTSPEQQQAVASGETSGGAGGENTSGQQSRDQESQQEQAEAAQGTQQQQAAQTSTAEAKPTNQQTERNNAAAVESGSTASIDKANEDLWNSGYFETGGGSQ